MKPMALFLALLIAAPAEATPIIRFAANVESDVVAEDSILVLHCVSTRTGLAWEFSGEASGSHWLRATEKHGKAEIVWHRPEGERTALLSAGGSEEACDQLEPSRNDAKALDLTPATAKNETALAGLTDTEEGEGAGRTWFWVGLGAAAVGGFLLWKARQPDHRGVEMR